jgi:hypothetical protein
MGNNQPRVLEMQEIPIMAHIRGQNNPCPAGTQFWNVVDYMFKELQPRHPNVGFAYANLPWSLDPSHRNAQQTIEYVKSEFLNNPGITLICILVGTDGERDNLPGHFSAIAIDKRARTLEHFDSNMNRPHDFYRGHELGFLWDALVALVPQYNVLWASGMEDEYQHGPVCGTYASMFITFRAQGVSYKEAVASIVHGSRWSDVVRFHDTHLAKYMSSFKRTRNTKRTRKQGRKPKPSKHKRTKAQIH